LGILRDPSACYVVAGNHLRVLNLNMALKMAPLLVRFAPALIK
jgi:hypothetical protein